MDKQDIINALRLVQDYCNNTWCADCHVKKWCLKRENKPAFWEVDDDAHNG